MINKLQNLSVLSAPFRLMFFLTALSGFLMPAVWVSFYTGKNSYTGGILQPMNWHAFEMLFGFSSALLAGFLLTASANWSQKSQISGWPILLLGVIWVVERIISLLPNTSIYFLFLTSCSFSVVFLALLIRNLKTNKKNAYIFLPLILIFGVAKILLLLGTQVESLFIVKLAKQMGIDVIKAVIVIITGRVVPFFMRVRLNVPNLQVPLLWERGAIYSFVVAVLVSYFPVGSEIKSALWLVCSLFHIVRFYHFQPHLSFKEPMLLILQVAYLFLIVSFVQEGLVFMYPVLVASKLHVFTTGAIGLFGIGMLVRVSLGHTGRKIKIDFWILSMFVCVFIGALTRIIFPMFFPEHYMKSLHYSSGIWTLAFGLYLLRFTGLLFKKRAT